ncbi:hypothetical protein ACFZBE_40005 [Streptomyces sp. NPDC008061]|uniref:hypothetical protein n=1 Tax=Streptomyces sp. NPDC008061 TaxID=3364805 RepID=UPI0036EB6249
MSTLALLVVLLLVLVVVLVVGVLGCLAHLHPVLAMPLMVAVGGATFLEACIVPIAIHDWASAPAWASRACPRLGKPVPSPRRPVAPVRLAR